MCVYVPLPSLIRLLISEHYFCYCYLDCLVLSHFNKYTSAYILCTMVQFHSYTLHCMHVLA